MSNLDINALTLEDIKNDPIFSAYDDLAKRLWNKRTAEEVIGTVFCTRNTTVKDIDTGATRSYEFTTFTTDPETLPLLLREEYGELSTFVWDAVNKRPKDKPVQEGIVVLGNPGIGKSTFLKHFLVESLLDAKPILFFDPRLIEIVVAISGPCAEPVPIRRMRSLDHTLSRGILLMDSDAEGTAPPASLWDLGSNVFVVHATSPKPTRWHRWVKLRRAAMFWMRCWSWDEVYAQGCCVNTLDAAKMRRAFTKYGPVARDVFEAASSPAKAENLDYFLEACATSIATASPNQILPSSNQTLMPVDNEDPSSRLFLIHPKPGIRNATTVDFVSSYARDLFCEAVEENEKQKLQSFYQLVSANPRSATVAGWIWEFQFLKWLKNSRQPIDMTTLGVKTPSTTIPNRFSLPRPSQFHVIYFDQMDTTVTAQLAQGPVLLIPHSRTHPTWDAAAIFDGRITLFQTTRAARHSINTAGLESLHTALGASSPYLPTAQKPWRLVFIVPKDVTHPWGNEQTISGYGGKIWKPWIQQYVGRYSWEEIR